MSDVGLAARLWSFQVWPAWAYTVVIFVFGSMPPSGVSSRALNDKLVHFVGFGILAWLLMRAAAYTWSNVSGRSIALGALLVSSLLGGLLELWQGLLTYRSREPWDWVADTLGAAFGVVVVEALGARARARSKARAE